MAIADFPRDLFRSRCVKDGRSVNSSTPTLDPPASQTEAQSETQSEAQTDVSSIVSSGRVVRKSKTLDSKGSLSELPAAAASSQQSLPLPESASVARSGIGTETFSSRANSRTQSYDSQKTQTTTQQPSSQLGLTYDNTMAAGSSVSRIVSTGVKSQMNFCLGLAKGFRNIPRLYNDDTVRPIEKVTDLNSGIKVAGKELGLGFYDGIAGLVTQPIRGAEKEGAGGFVKGIGKGIGGLIAKPAAGEL